MTIPGNSAHLVGGGVGQVAPGVYQSAGPTGPFVPFGPITAYVVQSPFVSGGGPLFVGDTAVPHSSSLPNGLFEVRILETDYAFYSVNWSDWTRVGDVPNGFSVRMPDGSWKSLWQANAGLNLRWLDKTDTFAKVPFWAPQQINGYQALSVYMPDDRWQRVANFAAHNTYLDGVSFLRNVPVQSPLPVAEISTWEIFPQSSWSVAYVNDDTEAPVSSDFSDIGVSPGFPFHDIGDTHSGASLARVVGVLSGALSIHYVLAIGYSYINLNHIRWLSNTWYFGKTPTLSITVGTSGGLTVGDPPVTTSISSSASFGTVPLSTSPRGAYFPSSLPGFWLDARIIDARPPTPVYLATGVTNGAVLPFDLSAILAADTQYMGFAIAAEPVTLNGLSQLGDVRTSNASLSFTLTFA
jgi:hypothetical protein